MARLLGVDIPNRKKIEFSLRYIYGVGPTRAKKILEVTGIDPDRRTQDLNEQELSKISNYIIDEKVMVEGDLRSQSQIILSVFKVFVVTVDYATSADFLFVVKELLLTLVLARAGGKPLVW